MTIPIDAIPRNQSDPNRRKAKAVFVSLARNSDLWPLLDSMKQMEDRFNHWAGYDWVFLNDEPFDDVFIKYTSELTNSKCHYGLIEPDHWHQPDWIDEQKASAAREEMIRKQVIYGHSVPYRNMCRFNSGVSTALSKSPMPASSDEVLHSSSTITHSWTATITIGESSKPSLVVIEIPTMCSYHSCTIFRPHVKFFCDISYDPFLVMQDQKKVYGFTISLFEYIETIPTLWDTVKGRSIVCERCHKCIRLISLQTHRVHAGVPRVSCGRQWNEVPQ